MIKIEGVKPRVDCVRRPALAGSRSLVNKSSRFVRVAKKTKFPALFIFKDKQARVAKLVDALP